MRERPHKHEIPLSEGQRFLLQQLISSGKAPARQLTHARILLKIDRNAPGPRWTDEQVADHYARASRLSNKNMTSMPIGLTTLPGC
jgi:hypothetical protein